MTDIFRAYVFSSSVCSCSMSTVKNPVLLANLYGLQLIARNQRIMSTVWSIIATQHQDRALEDDDVVATLNEQRSWPEAVNNQINGQLIQGQRKSIPSLSVSSKLIQGWGKRILICLQCERSCTHVHIIIIMAHVSPSSGHSILSGSQLPWLRHTIMQQTYELPWSVINSIGQH